MLADAPRLPCACDHLWSDFLDLHVSRAQTMSGPARISFTDIDAFERVNGTKLLAWQIDAIRRADSAFMSTLKEAQSGD